MKVKERKDEKRDESKLPVKKVLKNIFGFILNVNSTRKQVFTHTITEREYKAVVPTHTFKVWAFKADND